MNTSAVERCRNSVDWGEVWFVLVCHPNMIEICQDHVRKSVEFVSLLLEFATGCRFFLGIKSIFEKKILLSSLQR